MAMTTRFWTTISGLGVLLSAVAVVAMLAAPATPTALAADEPARESRAGTADAKAEDQADPALERAREKAKMLDALYKNAVVSITERYQRGQPAIMVAKDVFEAMEKSGYHSARLVGATDFLMNDENVPKTPFEKRAVKVIQKGEPYYEEVAGPEGDRTLMVATIVPAVHERCASCHAVSKGDLLGFLRYEIAVD